jgi:hypothetical protein
VTEIETEVDDPVAVVAVDPVPVAELLLTTDAPRAYISNLFPAPQYSNALPGHVKLQSP